MLKEVAVVERLNPEKLTVEYKDGISPVEPIRGRKYTLTHSDKTADLFLTIGLKYDYEKISPIRDEVLADLKYIRRKFVFYAYCYVGGEKGKAEAELRYNIFVKELPLALEAIRYGDRFLYEKYPWLDKMPVWIYFKSVYSRYNKIEYWGRLGDYK